MNENGSQKAAPSQFDKFKEAARDLETDDDEARFDERMKGLLGMDDPERQRKPKAGEKPE